ncbi:MAG: hypothetical protein KGL44_05265 [Sphingomonadales bacterium]|nr:hypothetical protein [Sphingomonadales bacterium]
MSASAVQRVVTAAFCMGSAVLAMQAEAEGEELGGVLTGPFNVANMLGLIGLLAAAVCALIRPRAAFAAGTTGLVLILPMQTWRLAPGLWCLGGNCSVSYPLWLWNGTALAALGAGLAAVALACRARRA